ncbi:MAG: hypothetical protein NC344_11040 [Bacteroidales bacterium]|nr:hypothetical protein [Bacteroidales bacterium]MCM1148341.1 hypothetical protein [Bacteroidales bacterium]MCM1206966.1 hypothetical protein [Bacillota bacterium]MCM1511262.1 hypothetical protein [Clostridium sp.]
MKKSGISTAVSPSLPSSGNRLVNYAGIFLTVSILLVSVSSYGCWYSRPLPTDNMIYRLVEDVSPYYVLDSAPYFYHANNSTADFGFRRENIALCLRDGGLCLMETAMPETYGDFAKALKNLGVSEALALAGGSAAAMWRERDGRLMQNGCVFGEDFPYENYIVWRK